MAAVFLMGMRPYHSYDVWHHIRSGWYAVPWHHGPAATEPFSAPGRHLGLEWIQYEWLAQILIYLSHVHLGVAGTVLAKAGLFALAFWMLAKAARARGAGRMAAALAVLAAGLAASPQFQVRPGVFTYLAFGAILWTLETWRKGGKEAGLSGPQPAQPPPEAHWFRLILLPVVFALWANLHGAYVAGWVLLGIWAFGEYAEGRWSAWRKRSKPRHAGGRRRAAWLGYALAACVAAVCVNPYGLRLLTVPFKLTTDQTVRAGVMEWKPADLGIWLSPENLFILLFAAVLALGWRRLRLSDWLTVAAFGFLSTTARRHIPLAAFMCAPIAADAMTPALKRLVRRLSFHPPKRKGLASQGGGDPAAAQQGGRWRRMPAWAGQALFVLLALAAAARPLGLDRSPLSPIGFTLRHFGLGVEEAKYPLRSAEFVAQFGPGGSVFNEYGDGNYLIWRLNRPVDDDFAAFESSPPYLVFVDGRIDVYGERVMNLYLQGLGAREGWRDILDEFAVAVCIVPYARPEDASSGRPTWPLADALWEAPGWSLVFWDDERMVFFRSGAVSGLGEFRFRPDLLDPTALPSTAALEAAIQELERRAGMGPELDSARSRELLGLALQAAGRFGEAVPHFRRAGELQPDDPRHAYHLGAALLQSGRPEEAVPWFRMASRLRPQEPAAVWNALAYAHILSGEPERGLRAARRALRRDPGHLRSLLTLSLALEKTGQLEEARQAADRALEVAPGDPSALQRRRELGP